MTHSSLFSGNVFKKILIGGLLEFGPIIIFLLSFEHFHVYKATLILMIMTIFSTLATYIIQKRLPYLALYVALLTLVFGYLTISHHQPRFIQMRDTLYDITCALTLLIGLMINVPFLKLAFDKVLVMTIRAWTRLTYGWIFFFVMAAILNEHVRRTMSLQVWFDFKAIMAIATCIFGIILLYGIYEKSDEEV